MPENKTDKWFKKILTYITKKIQTFVAFLFLLISIGMLLGYLAVIHTGENAIFFMIIPACLGLLAYFNRDLAIIFFVLFLGIIAFV